MRAVFTVRFLYFLQATFSCAKINSGDIMKEALFEQILFQLENNCPVVLMTIYKTSGSTPRKVGAKMACFSDFTTCDTIGGGAIEHDAIECAKELFDTKTTFCKTYTLNHSDSADLGMVCGGECSVFFQYISPDDHNVEIIKKAYELIKNKESSWLITAVFDNYNEMSIYTTEGGFFGTGNYSLYDGIFESVPKLSSNGHYLAEPLYDESVVYIFGGGHIAQALCPLLKSCDFNVVVYEDNENFAHKDLFPDAQKIICASYLDVDNNVKISENDYCVVLTRGHQSDNEVIRQILATAPYYLGVIGSKKKVANMKNYLSNCGFESDEIERIYSPVGLEINAQTPSEIAVSITAQLISLRSKKR